MTDGTAPRELVKAMSTYLNLAGAGDYDLPALTGGPLTQSSKRTVPAWSLQSRNKIGWQPVYHNNNHFLGVHSPAATRYDTAKDNHYYRKVSVSLGKDARFAINSGAAALQKQVPVQYLVTEPYAAYTLKR